MILDYCSLQEAVAQSRAAASAVAVGENRILCRALGRFLMFADERDISYMPYLAMDGMYEPHLVDLLCQCIKPGMAVADIGACFGFTSLLAGALVGDRGAVYAFEPNSRAFHILKQNVEMNDMREVIRFYPLAIGEAVGDREIMFHKRRFDASTMAEKAMLAMRSEDKRTVKTCSLSYTMAQCGASPDFYIISTSGYEPQVFQGMQQLLNAKRKISMLMAFTPRWYEDPAAFGASIIDNGFVVNRVARDGTVEPLIDPDQFRHPMGRSDLLLTR